MRLSAPRFASALREFCPATKRVPPLTLQFMEHLEGWFHKQIYKKGFYKFAAPCAKHPLYKKGDSWCEVLGISYKKFVTLSAVICTRYKTKTLFDKSTDKFKGKPYVSYVDHKSNKTYYIRNNPLADTILSKCCTYYGPTKLSTESVDKSVDNLSHQLSGMSNSIKKGHSSDCQKGHSLCAGALTANTQLLTSLREVSAKIEEVVAPVVELSLQNSSVEQPTAAPQVQQVEQMVAIFNLKTASSFKLLPSSIKKLWKVLQEQFQGCLKIWRTYCDCISTSDFLCGRAKNTTFKAVLHWIIKPDIFARIAEGCYGVKDKLFASSDDLYTKKQQEIKCIDAEIITLEEQIALSCDEIRHAQRTQILEAERKLTVDQIADLKAKFVSVHGSVGNRGVDRSFFNIFIWQSLEKKFGFGGEIVVPLEFSVRKEQLLAKKGRLLKEYEPLCEQHKDFSKKVIDFFKGSNVSSASM